tara:strand:- start:463 stop:1056 length:594 start_codon:yes stop_codon:yes gene_type:complete
MNTARNIVLSILLYLFFLNSSFAKNPSDFIQEITDNASNILSSDLSKIEKQNKLKDIAKDAVDIKGIGFYTLGKFRKNLNEDTKKEYSILFKEYFLKSFSSRLVEYSNPKISVVSEEILNEKYTMVSSVLAATEDRPEIKIDWRVYTKNQSEPLIRDLIIEGLSLARTQKEEFSSIIISNNNDIKYLFSTLEEFIKN